MHRRRKPGNKRLGSILVLSAAVFTVILAFVAFSLDLGFITYTRSQLHAGADAAALAAAQELAEGYGPFASQTTQETEALAQEAAREIASLHPSGDLDSITILPERDVRLGHREWNQATGGWSYHWEKPYNLVAVTTRRIDSDSQEDRALPLFFAPLIGHKHAEVTVTAIAGLRPSVGFRQIPQGSNPPVLPITYDLPSWETLKSGHEGPNFYNLDGEQMVVTFEDNYSVDPKTKTVTKGADGILEFNLYPSDHKEMPSGNRGTVKIGVTNNGTPTLSRQIRTGLNEQDLRPYGGELSFENGPIHFDGNPGLSAAIKDDLASIIGEVRAIPIFTTFEGNGSKATFTIVKFVGVRILAVQLTGHSKHVIVQPATLTHPTLIPGHGELEYDSLLAPAAILH
jgi:hypothetical protein